jgi:hypothetical protein
MLDFINRQRDSWYSNSKSNEPRPKTCRSAFIRFWRQKFTLLCFECGQMAPIVDVIDIADAPRSYTADVALSCGHSRNYHVAVSEKFWRE